MTVNESLNPYVSVYSCADVREPDELSAIALIGVREFVATELPEDRQFDQFYNVKIGNPVLDVVGLRHVTGEAPESILDRAARALENTMFFEVTDKQLMVNIELIGPTPVNDLMIDGASISSLQLGGNKVSYDSSENVYTVPVRDVASALVASFGREAINVGGALELAEALDQQLMELSLGDTEFESLLLAVGMGVWKVTLEHKRDSLYVADKSSRGHSRDTDWANVGLRDG